MTDEDVPESGNFTRRRALQVVAAGGAVGLAGCSNPDTPCDLTLSKEHSGDPVTYGGTTEFEISVCNEGDEECTDGVTVTDDLPSGTTFDSVGGSGWTASESGGVVTCEHPNANGLGGGDCLPTLTLTVEVGQPDEVGPEIANCATVEQGDPDTRSKTDCVKVPVEPPEGECDLAISKRYGADTVTEGSAATFQIEVCNEGDGVCTDPVTVVDGLPNGVTFDTGAGSGWSVTQSGGSVVATHANGGGLDAGECLPILELTLGIGPISETGDAIRNCASLKVDDANDANDVDCVSVPVDPGELEGECDLAISKRYGADTVTEGSPATFEIEVCNEGDEVCEDEVTVVDGLPAGVTFGSGSGTGWSVSQSGGSVVATHDNSGGLDPGECLPVLELTVNIGSMSVTGDAIRNCASLKVADSNAANDRDCVSVPVEPGELDGECDLGIRKTSSADAVTEESGATFEVTICNEGDGICDEPVTVVDGLPGGVSFETGAGTGWSFGENNGTVTATHANGGGLDPGECLPTMELNVQIGAIEETGDQIRNCASIEGTDANPDNNQNCVSVPVQPAAGECDLAVTKTHAGGGVVTAGEPTEFDIVVCNQGDGDCDEEVTLTDDLPDGLTYTSANGTGWSVNQSGGVVTATHGNGTGLAPGDCLPALTLAVDVGSIDETGDQIRNCVSIDGSDVNARNDRDCAVVTVTQPVESCNGLTVEKLAATQFTYGAQEEYDITVCNPTDAQCDSQVTVTDDLPDGMSFVSAAGSGWTVSVSGGVVTATHPNNGALSPGSCLPTLTLTVDVVPAAQFPGGSDAVQNCAQLVVDGAVVNEGCVTHVITNN
ncbi:DUF11 domain-containing protein [Haloglomus halophilum]|uniref:DUF11 domain-containing protein n=1 Tax=Haloglomus halophilum TaxID=2962672 RepID=UPI0020C93DCD|nr:DUF11 domain-containing protein [Haloglomus halophilum]